MTTSREIQLITRPEGMPQPEHFRTVTRELPDPEDGQILVRNEWMSVDPAMRGRMRDLPSYVPPFQLNEPMEATAVGTVMASRSSKVAEGATVVHQLGFRDHALVDASTARQVDPALAVEHLGVLGITGLTAYAGLTRIAPVREGDVVFVSGAAGAVGLAAVRIARHLGASRVIGSAGGPEKARRLVEEFGCDAAIDYTAGPVRRQLREHAPNGIDVYFDNVGGDHLDAALLSLTRGGRVALCGMISQYNEQTAPIRNLAVAISNRLSLRGFIVLDHFDLFSDWVSLGTEWLADGTLTNTHTVVDGLDNAVDALLGLFRGDNVGKMVVRVG